MPSVRSKRKSGVSQAAQVADSLPVAWPAEGGALEDCLFKLGVRYLAVGARFSDTHDTEKSDGPKKCCVNHTSSELLLRPFAARSDANIANEASRLWVTARTGVGKPIA